MKKSLGAAIALMTALSLAGCAPAATESTESASETASSEPLVVYAGRSEELVQPLIDQFTEATGIEVEVRYAGSAELAAQILEEGANSPADVFFAQDAGALGAVSKAGLLKTLDQSIRDLVSPEYGAKDGSWIGVSGRVRVLNYNPERVTELPKSVFDLANPEYQGRVGIAPTNASFQAFVTAMRLIEGEAKTLEWLEAMKVNGVVYEKNGAILDAVEAGAKVTELDVTNRSVGVGGRPDADGHVTLDACIMNWESHCGAVGYLEGIKHPLSVARHVMEHTQHVMLVGEGAKKYALKNQFATIKTPLPEVKKDWEKWKKEQEAVI